MLILQRSLVVVALVAASVVMPVGRAHESEIAQGLASPSLKVRGEVLQALGKSREITIQELMGLVRKQQKYDHTDTTVLAIQALGVVRAAEAADLLAGMIGMEAQTPNFATTDIEMSFGECNA